MTLRPQISAVITTLLLIGISVWSIWMMQPPAPVPATAPASEFSAKRAFAHVKAIGQEPHAMGTPAHATARAYLLAQMHQLNVNPQIQEATVAHRRGSSVGYVYNLVGRISGQQTGVVAPRKAGPRKAGPRKAVLMLAHYDSQPNARGAADDASSVAAILETARALQQGPPLQNDVIFLITDGEEYGLYGAQAFLRHPWAKDVAFVMNLEARGTRGPSMTFEISPENGWSVEAFGKAAPYPLASSLMYEIYRSLPNNTDFTIYREAGYAGINSAYIDGFVHYHKLTDSPENLDLGSLQHHGSNLLAMTRYVANQSLEQTKAPDKVFFNTVGFHFVQYPMSFNWLFAVLLTVVLGLTLVVGVRKRVLTVWQSLAGAGLFLLMIIVIVALFWPITAVVRQSLPPAFYFQPGEGGGGLLAFRYYINGIYGSDRFLVAYSLLAIGLFGLLTRLVLQWIRPFSFIMGVYLLLFILVIVQVFLLPSTAFQLMFPVLFSATGTLIALKLGLPQRQPSLAYDAVALLAALPTLLLIPLVRLLFVTFDLQMPVVVAVLLLVVVLGLLLPVGLGIELAFRWRNWPIVSLKALVIGLLVTIWAVRAEAPSAEQPLHSQVAYYLDADTKQAYWASASQATDQWKQQFFTQSTVGSFTDYFPHSGRRWLKNRAEPLALPAPTAEVLSDSSSATSRTLTLRLRSVRGAAGFEIGLITKDTADVQAVLVNNELVRTSRFKANDGYGQYVHCNGLPVNKEISLTVQTRPRVPLRLLLYDETMELPTTLIKVPRPADVVYEQGQGSNQTVVRKEYRF